MADVKWIKITTDIFDDEKILLIESLPDAYAIIVVWFKLLCLAGKQNNSGVFMMNNQIAYTDKMLATIFRMKESTVTMALQTFEQFGMVEIIDGVITIPNWGKHQSLDQLENRKEFMRNYMKEYRAKQKALTSGDSKPSCKPNSKPNVRQAEEDKEREEEKDKEELSKDNSKRKPAKHKHGEFQHVLLTDSEYENLANAYGVEMRDQAITFLDAYIEEKGYKSKSHNLAIRRWVIDAVNEQQRKGQPARRKEPVPKWCAKGDMRSYIEDFNKRTAANDPDIAARAERLKRQFDGGD